MHIYYQTPIKILLYILQYCILIKHYASTTHACLSTIYGTTWGPVLVVPTSVADSYQRQNTNSLRHSLCLYSTGKNTLPSATLYLGSQVNMYQQAQQYIIQVQQYILNILIGTTPNAYILLNSNQDITIYTIVLHTHQALCQYHSRLPQHYLWKYLGQQYQWCPLQQQIVIKDKIQAVFGIACACITSENSLPSATLYLGSQVNIYQQAQQYILQIQQYILNILTSTTPNAYILLNSNQDIPIYTIVLHTHQALSQYHSRLPWCCLWNYLGSSTSGAHFSSRQLLKIKYKQSSAQPVLALLVRIAFLVLLCTWAHK
ncbi:hypothetical protein SS50377_22230 [Spironucleus salmonicida]|uniref:Uncharacterized protein n=1 Tax=Spironucleus salmonicida TaxID=348837 RepID=A0A9P8LUJ2_9EUKA|nr:hypothetical protein SS50377_22230 [Spironucleus salmonicida]